ncbi:MAG: deoxyribodipyrimidine photo-lyase [Pseudomonadota bacterium]
MFYICSMSGLHVLWFQHDLRVHDHAALRAACQNAERDGGQVLALFIRSGPSQSGQESQLWTKSFLTDALWDLRRALEQRGAALHVRQGDVLDVFSDLHTQHQIISLHHHHDGPADETLRKVEAWALRAGVRFNLYKQMSPARAPRDRTPGQSLWEQFMARPRHEAPDSIVSANVGIGQWPQRASDATASDMSITGGRKAAIRRLRAFLGAQVSEVPERQSAKSTFDDLQPHMLLGTVSLREVWQAAIGAHQQALKSGHDIRAASIASFLRFLPEVSEGIAPVQAARVYRPRRAKRAGDQLSLGLGDPN